MGLFHTMKKSSSAQKAAPQPETPEKEEQLQQPPPPEANQADPHHTHSAGSQQESATPEKLPNTPLQNPTPPNKIAAPSTAASAMTTPSPGTMHNYYYHYPTAQHPPPAPYPYPYPMMPPQQQSPATAPNPKHNATRTTTTTANNNNNNSKPTSSPAPTGATPEKPIIKSEGATTTPPSKPANVSQQQPGQAQPSAQVMYTTGFPPYPPPPYGYPYPAYGSPPPPVPHDHYYGNPAAGKAPPQPYAWPPPPPPPGYPNPPQYWPPQPWQQVPKALPRSKAHNNNSNMVNKKAPNVKSIKFTKPTEKIADRLAEDDRTPAAIEDMQREDIQNMGCTCKRTKCLKLYCQCFGAKLMCGPNCRCTDCSNTDTNEAERTEAIRTILSRNPCAFDAKYKADNRGSPNNTNKAKEHSSSGSIHNKIGGGPTDVTHRIGCKCRKSACMKKYCECYAGHIKCTDNCRCVGCLNRGPSAPGGSAPPAAQILPAYYPPPAVYGPPPHVYGTQQPQPVAMVAQPVEAPHAQDTSSEPWEAAQSLTFLKRGTPPTSDKKRPSTTGGLGTLGVSPITKMDLLPTNSTPDSDHKILQGTTPQSSGDQDMLSAAIAMTEFQQSPPPSTSSTGGMLNTSPESVDFANSKRSIPFDEDSNDAIADKNGDKGSHQKKKIKTELYKTSV